MKKFSITNRNKQLTVPAIIIMDVLLIGISLVIFALFHHVLPRVDSHVLEEISTKTPPKKNTYTVISETVNSITTDNSTSQNTQTHGILNTSEIRTHTANTTSTNTTYKATNGQTPGPTPIKVIDPALPIDLSGWGAKFRDKFTNRGSVYSNNLNYVSKDINVTITTVEKNGIVYIIQDIYIRKIECFRTALAKDKFGKSITEDTLKLAKRKNAICAVNGDYYGAHESYGVIIKNGWFYKNAPFNDVGVLYYNGEMKTYTRQEFASITKELAEEKEIYQAWCFGPSLLDDNGKAKTSYDTKIGGKNPRTAIGYYEPGHYCFVAVDGRQSGYSKGMTMVELGQLFESLGCKTAYNLDGGQTTVMTYKDKVINSPYNGGRSCSDIVYICEWEDNE